MCVLDDPDLRWSPIIKHLCGSDQVQSLPPAVTQKKFPRRSSSRIPLKT